METPQICKALQRVVRLPEGLLSLQDIYLKRCKSRAAKIIKDLNHLGNRLFFLLPSGKRFLNMMAKTERLRRSFFPQAKYFALLIGLCQSRAFIMCDVTCQRPIQRLLHKLLPRQLFPRFHSSFFKKRFALR